MISCKPTAKEMESRFEDVILFASENHAMKLETFHTTYKRIALSFLFY